MDKYKCQSCESQGFGPMLVEGVWLSISDKKSFMCMPCMESRLGRRLRRSDLKDVPGNANERLLLGRLEELSHGRKE